MPGGHAAHGIRASHPSSRICKNYQKKRERDQPRARWWSRRWSEASQDPERWVGAVMHLAVMHCTVHARIK